MKEAIQVLRHLYGPGENRFDDDDSRVQLEVDGVPSSPEFDQGFMERFDLQGLDPRVLLLHPGGLKFPRRVLPAQTLRELRVELQGLLRANHITEDDLVQIGFTEDVARKAFAGEGLTLEQIAEFRFE